MQPKHTPGPWTPSFGRGQHGHAWHDAMVYVAPDIFDEIAICPERLVFGPDGNGDETLSRLQVEANARLIAAAPDFLKACTLERDGVSRLHWLSALLTKCNANFAAWAGDDREAAYTALHEASCLLSALRDAVAKAEGGSDVA
jgi:hypothetical protein